MSDSQPKVALITGSGRDRVGNVIAQHLAKLGYQIALHYHSSEEEAIESRDDFRNRGVRCEAYKADVANQDEVDRMVAGVCDDFGRIDVLVTTSSIWSPEPLENVTVESLRNNFDVNSMGTFLVGRAAGLMMVGQPEGGSIVTIGDWAIDRPYLDFAAYYLSKGTIPTMTRVLAAELGHRNPKVRVNCIHPGPVMFPPNASEEEKESLIESTLVKDADCPEMVAQAVEFFVGNSFVTGTCLPVDGGQHFYTPERVRR